MSEIRDDGDSPDCHACGWAEIPGALVKKEIEGEVMSVMLCPECVSSLIVCDRCGKSQALDQDDFSQVRLPATQWEPPEVDMICWKCNGED